MGAMHGLSCIGFFTRVVGALIKCHRDVSTNVTLYIHHKFWCEYMLAAIDV